MDSSDTNRNIPENPLQENNMEMGREFAMRMENLASQVEAAGLQLNAVGSQLTAVGKMLANMELLRRLISCDMQGGESRTQPEDAEREEQIVPPDNDSRFSLTSMLLGGKKSSPKNEALYRQYVELKKKYADADRRNEDLQEKLNSLQKESDEKGCQFAAKVLELEKAEKRIEEFEAAYTRLEAENARQSEELRKNQGTIDSCNANIDELIVEKNRLERQLEVQSRELQTARDQNALLDAQMPPNAPELKEIAEKLEQIPANFRGLASGYYNLEQFPVFLSQSGQYNLLTQFWEGCFDKCRNGAEPGNIADFLLLLLRLYNAANPASQFSINFPKPGDIYDYTSQLRNGNNGQRVQRPLLPGLVKPNGEHAVKALVDVI